MVLCLGEPPESVRDVGCCCCCFPQWRFFTFPGYFSLPSVLHHAFSGPWRPPPALNSILATFGCFAFSQAFPPQFYRERYGFERAFFTHRLPVFYLPLLPHIFDTLCDSDSCRNTPSRSSFVPALTELSLPVGTWTWTTHIVFTRLLIYQLRQWATKYRVKIKLLNMFRLFKIIRKDYQNTLNKTW